MKSAALPLLLTICFASLFVPVISADDSLEFFEKQVRHLLIEKCLDCHSADKKIKGGLRLDHREGWQTGGDSGTALVPHEPDSSLLMKAVSYTDRDLKMPPKMKLSAEEIAVLQQWIAQGAPDPRIDTTGSAATPAAKPVEQKSWWSFQPVRQSPVPALKDPNWSLTTSDHYILSKLEEKQLLPGADASPAVLGRRLYYDLCGLPPSREELENFIAACQTDRQGAIKNLVDKLLGTAAYGERWGRHWLDLVRFAESSGGGRTLPFKDAWRYRDYVVESIRQDVPLDKFLTEQLAGDLLPSSSPAERRKNLIATGFLTLGPTNYEEQDKQMLRMDIVDEQLDNLGKSFLGMTIGCARCHDHKFDPIPTRDYYALAGILRSTKTLKNYEDNVAHWIDTPLPMEGAAEEALRATEAKLASLNQKLTAAKKELKKQQPQSPKLDAGMPIAIEDLRGIVVDDSQAKAVGNWVASTRYPTYIGEGYVTDKNQNKDTCTLTFTPEISKTGRYEVRFAYTALADRATNVPVTIFHAEGEETLRVDQTETPPVDSRFVSLGQYRFEKNGQGHVILSNEGTKGYVTADALVFIPVEELNSTSKGKNDDQKAPLLLEAERNLTTLEKEIKDLKSHSPARPETMTVMEDSAPEDCPVHIRGSIRNLGARVPRGFLTAATLSEAPRIPETSSGRLELAGWLTAEGNPLTSRVLVNRVWMWLFGEGLVRTVDNFGTTGETPSHPELLDALALQFMEDGWSLQTLIRHLVTSRVYQLDSSFSANDKQQKCITVDPENRLLWRQNRRSLDAESLRDTMLSVAGTLDRTVGGPNMQAESVDSNSGLAQDLEYAFVFRDTRRSLYTPAFRNKRLELFEVFDFADINQPLGKRTQSTVAPQALYMMNHPFVVEQSRKAAERIIKMGSEDGTLVRQAYLETLGREPTQREMQLATHFVQTEESDARLMNWSLFLQSLFASVDFRYLK